MSEPVDQRVRQLLDLIRDLEEAGALDEEAKTAAAALLGRLGGRKGGLARAQKLSPERRSEIARQAAEARWKKAKESD